MISVSVSLRGVKETRGALNRVSRVISDMRPTVRRVRRDLVVLLQQHVATQGRSGGTPWRGYSGEPKYRAWKQATTGHLDLLVMDRANPVVLPSVTGGAFHPTRISRDGLSFGTRHPFAVALHDGGIGPFGEPYPGRPLIAITSAQADGLVDTMVQSIQERIAK